jgi:outer membrane protein assembly factor BamB
MTASGQVSLLAHGSELASAALARTPNSMSGVVRAYDAADFDAPPAAGAPAKLHLLWEQAGFQYSKFCPPVVADGRLLVPTYDGRVDVYVLNGEP